jgi:uncharacterized protein
MIHPDTALRYIDDEIGYGVFATRRIPKGTITWARDKFDLEFNTDQVEIMDPLHASLISKYAYRNQEGNFILCWDFGRYINHSFNSNCMSTGYDFELAIRDIEAGEELTDDYGYLNLQEPFKAREEDSPRKYVYPDDLPRYYKKWDADIKSCLPLIQKVRQPLLPLISAADLFEIKETIEGRREMKSILTHYFRDPASSTAVLHKSGVVFPHR